MNINRNNYETFLVEKLEGLLSTEQNAEVDLFLHNNPDIMQEWEAFTHTVLVPDETIRYEHKAQLKQKEIRVVPIYRTLTYVVSIAASLLLLFFVAQKFLFNSEINKTQPIAAISNSSAGVVQSVNSNTSSNNSTPVLADNSIQPHFSTSKDTSVSFTSNPVQPVAASLNRTSIQSIHSRDGIVRVRTASFYPFNIRTGSNASNIVYGERRNTQAGAWLQVASVLGAEIVRLSGRGELVNSPAPLKIQVKDFPMKKQVEETYSRIHKILPFLKIKKSIHK